MMPFADSSEAWVTHTFTGAIGFVASLAFQFILSLRKQKQSEYEQLFAAGAQERTGLLERIASLETRADGMQKRFDALSQEHLSCIEANAEMRTRIAALERVKAL